MPLPLFEPAVPYEPRNRIMRVALVQLVTALTLTYFDWYAFNLVRQPEVSAYLNSSERALLPILFVFMLATLLHIWVLTGRTVCLAIRTRKAHHSP